MIEGESSKVAMTTSTEEMIRQIVTTTMLALKKQDEEKEGRRMQGSQITKCLRAVIDNQGEFDGTNVTKYLRIYWREVKLHDIGEEVAVLKFSTLAEPEIKKVVEKQIGPTKEERTWENFTQKMREEFLLQDADRVTQATFLDWVNRRNKGLGPQGLLKEFNKHYNQLSVADAEVIQAQRPIYLMRAADSQLRDELDYVLDLLRPKREGDAT